MKSRQFTILIYFNILFIYYISFVNAETVLKPVIYPETATSFPINVSINCITPDVDIHYTTDGTRPDQESPIYSNPLSIESSTIIRARAFKEGMSPSHTAHVIYENNTSSEYSSFTITKTILNNNSCYPTVKISIVPDKSVQSFAFEELLPDGLIALSINEDGFWDSSNKKVRWGVFLDNDRRDLLYKLTGGNDIWQVTK